MAVQKLKYSFSKLSAKMPNTQFRQLIPTTDSLVEFYRNLKKPGGFIQKAQSRIIVFSLSVIGQLPRKVTLWFGARLGDLFYISNQKRRKIAYRNLEICFPNWPVEKRNQVMRDHFRSYGQAITDLGMLWKSSEKRLSNYLTVHGLEHWRKAINDRRPVILFIPHMVSVDAANTLLSLFFPLCGMMNELRNPFFSEHIRSGRSRFGTKVFFRSDGVRPMIKNLLNNVSCVYLSDGDFGERNSIFVPFFGTQTATLTTLGRMARITKAVAIPVCSVLNPKSGQYIITLKEPLENFPSDDQYLNARRMNSEFESIIKTSPEQYMWTLRWFRTRPENEPSLY